MTTLSISDTSYTSTVSRENAFPPRKTIRFSNPNKKTKMPLLKRTLLRNAFSQLSELSNSDIERLTKQQNLETNVKHWYEISLVEDISIKEDKKLKDKKLTLTPFERVQLESSAKIEAAKRANNQIKRFRQQLPENIQLALIGVFKTV